MAVILPSNHLDPICFFLVGVDRILFVPISIKAVVNNRKIQNFGILKFAREHLCELGIDNFGLGELSSNCNEQFDLCRARNSQNQVSFVFKNSHFFGLKFILQYLIINENLANVPKYLIKLENAFRRV